MTQISIVGPLPAQAPPAAPSLAVRKVFNTVSVVIALCVALLCAEGLLRLKNRSMTNYNIEMWRYSRELKIPSANPLLGHEHVTNKSAVLQSMEIRLNECGLRGGTVPPRTPGRRRILLLGSSITLGWGVPEEETLAVFLRDMFKRDGHDVEVLNAGIGNYNTARYVERFLTRLRKLEPTDIVVHYFINDAETLERGGGNFLLRHSQLAATLWTFCMQYTAGIGEVGLQEHYHEVYAPDAPGFVAMSNALHRLSEYAQENSVRVYLAMMPDVHNLADYKFHYIHDTLAKLSTELGYVYVDLYPGFRGLTPETVWSMAGDPHPNNAGHRIMAETLYPILAEQCPSGNVW